MGRVSQKLLIFSLLFIIASIISACEDHSFKPIEFDCQTTCSLDRQCAIEDCGGVWHTCVVLEGVAMWSADTIRCDDNNPCTASDQCIQEVCQGVDKICDQPPANYCDENILVTYPTTGTCAENGVCDYPQDLLICEESCLEARCQGQNCDCSGRECGSDNCGGTCGACDSNSSCNESGQCECTFLECNDICCAEGQNCDQDHCIWDQPFLPEVIIANIDDPTSVIAADLDGDNDQDVVVGSYGSKNIFVMENTDGQATFASPQETINPAIASQVKVFSVYAADLDQDSDLDLLGAFQANWEFTWYKNQDGQANFIPVTTDIDYSLSNHGFQAVDINLDGKLDILGQGAMDATWYMNSENLDGFFGNEQSTTIVENILLGFGEQSLTAADLDGDGDPDVVVTDREYGKILWHENSDSQGNFGAAKVITSNAAEVDSINTADVDGDGDIDVLSVSSGDGKIAWYQNTDGKGNFGTQQVIAVVNEPLSILGSDVDLDGDIDIVASISQKATVVWYENTDSLGNFGLEKVISKNTNVFQSIYSADLDGDGDPDILAASRLGGMVVWFENNAVP
jgi:hypothetical protein